jgi:hypothetical protein
LNTKSYASFFMASFIICIVTLALLGGAPATNATYPANGYDDSFNRGNLQYLRDIGPIDQNASIVNMQATRLVNIGDYGLVNVNDTVMVHNNDSSTISFWTFYLASDVYPSLRYIAAYGNGSSLDISVGQPFESFLGMRVDFTDIGGLPAGSSMRVTLIQEYSGLVKPGPTSGSTEVRLYFYKFLASPYITYNYTTRISLPTSASALQPISMTSNLVLPFNSSRLGSLPDGGYAYQLIGGQSLLEVKVDRVIEINVDGFLSITETHSITNLGPQSFSTIRFKLPLTPIPGSLEAHDTSGGLTINSLQNGSSRIGMASVSLRYPLDVNASFTYFVSYRAYIDDYRSFENGLYVIRMSPVTLFNCSVNLEVTSIVFPYRAQVYDASQNPSQIKIQGDNMVVSYSFQEVTFLNTSPIELKYTSDLGETFERPIILSLGIFLIGLLYIGVRKIFPRGAVVEAAREEEEKVRGLATTVNEFCSNYEEKTALTLELEKLAEDRRKGRVSKRAYMERLQLARRRIATLTNSINEEKKRLVPASKRYASIIRQLDTYEEERENARASLENLELRRRQGKVSGDVYNSLKYENTKKIERATSGIDALIVQFRQEAS